MAGGLAGRGRETDLLGSRVSRAKSIGARPTLGDEQETACAP